MTITVLRHADYNTSTGDILPAGRDAATQRWRELVEYVGASPRASDVLLISSSAPRARQTVDLIWRGMWLPEDHPVHTSDALWDDSNHSWDVAAAIAFIHALPPALFMVIVTHMNFVFPIATALWYHGQVQDGPHYLSGPLFRRETGRIIKSTPTTAEGLYRITLQEDFRTIDAVRIIAQLQKQVGTWQTVAFRDIQYRFLVPMISPNGDPAHAMIGWYDHEWSFPIMVNYDDSSKQRWATTLQDHIALLPIATQEQALRWIFWRLQREATNPIVSRE